MSEPLVDRLRELLDKATTVDIVGRNDDLLAVYLPEDFRALLQRVADAERDRDEAWKDRDRNMAGWNKVLSVLDDVLLHVHVAHNGVPREQFDCAKPQCAAIALEISDNDSPPSFVRG